MPVPIQSTPAAVSILWYLLSCVKHVPLLSHLLQAFMVLFLRSSLALRAWFNCRGHLCVRHWMSLSPQCLCKIIALTGMLAFYLVWKINCFCSSFRDGSFKRQFGHVKGLMMRFLGWVLVLAPSQSSPHPFLLLSDSISVFVFFSLPSLPTWYNIAERSPPDNSTLISNLSAYITSQSFLAIVNVPMCGASSITEAQDGLSQVYNKLWSLCKMSPRYVLYFVTEQVQTSGSTPRACLIRPSFLNALLLPFLLLMIFLSILIVCDM